MYRDDKFIQETILKKAFAGQPVAQDSSDEPASVLLEKIRTERLKGGKSGPTARRFRLGVWRAFRRIQQPTVSGELFGSRR